MSLADVFDDMNKSYYENLQYWWLNCLNCINANFHWNEKLYYYSVYVQETNKRLKFLLFNQA